MQQSSQDHGITESKEIKDRNNPGIQQGPGQKGHAPGSACWATGPRPGRPDAPRDIAVIRGGAIGDFVLTLPAIDALRQACRPARLLLIGNPQVLSLAPADRVLSHDSARLSPLYSKAGPIPPDTRSLFRDKDVVLAYAVDPDGVLERRLSSVVQGELILYDPRPDPGSRRHVTEHLLEPLQQRGVPVVDARPRVLLPAAGRASADRTWRQHDLGPLVAALHPGSGGRHKCWPLACYLALIEELGRRDVQTLLLGGPAEEGLFRELGPRPLPGCTILHPAGLVDLAGILERCELFIGNDSGPGHLAAALGTATVSLFGPTDPQVWRPRAPWSRCLQAPGGDWTALGVDSVLQVALECLPER